MSKISMTISGIVMLLAAQFVPVDELEVVMEAVGIILAWYGRYRVGDITLLGIRK